MAYLNKQDKFKCLYINIEGAQGLEQIDEYLDQCAQNEGHLVIFDRRVAVTWDEKIFRKQKMYNNKAITIWGM